MGKAPKTTAEQKYLDDLQPGERYAAPPMTLTPAHFQQFSALSGDDHPIHSDDDYARRCGMPGAVAQTSTFALNNETTRYAIAIAEQGLRKACAADPYLALGLNTLDGTVCHPAVAESLGYTYQAPRL